MSFKVRKIQDGNTKIKNRFWKWMVKVFGQRLSVLIVVVFLLSVSFVAGAMLFGRQIVNTTVRNIDRFVELKSDESGHTNILLLGTAGEGQEGGHLSDSIMVVSINKKTASVSFLGLPRDLYISSSIGDMKINEVYAKARWHDLMPKLESMNESLLTVDKKVIAKSEEKALEVVKKAVGDFTGADIHYATVVDFQIFQDVVNTLDGIDVFVPETIEDPFYPDGNYGYETFVIRKGLQHLDGAMALKYVRSRKTTSDYSRAQRQHDVALAIRQKAAELSILNDTDKLNNFYNIFKERIVTDLGITEIGALASIGMSINYENSVSAILNDDPSQKGGFLYPPAMDLYGGQFVLLPLDLKDTQTFMNLILLNPDILLEKAQIAVLNGSGVSGKAGDTASRLRRLGFHVIDTGKL